MLDAVIQIARDAGVIVNRHYADAANLEVVTKDDGSPLTMADQEANALIVERLEALTPDIPVIAEETGIPEYDTRKGWNRFWLVDPLDGTKEFIKRNGEFTVNIALIEDGVPTLGVVYAPALPLIYAASKGEGAFKMDEAGNREPIHSTSPTGETPLRVVTSRSHGGLADVEHLLPGWEIGEAIPCGSSLKICTVAEGKADAYPRKGPTMEWDVAAGDAVYRYSGEGAPRPSPLEYNKPTLKNSSFVIGIDE